MMIIELNLLQTLALAVVLLIVGRVLKQKVNILEKFCIPAPVIGGVLFAFLTLAGYVSGAFELNMDFGLKTVLMVAFFTTVGFTASLKLLKKGGMQVGIFLLLALILVVLQNVVGVSLAKVFGLNPLIGLATGSTPMTGGHGTSGAFAPLFEQAGATGATTVAMAAATFGLIFGSMIGGPIGQTLIKKNGLMETLDGIREVEMEETQDIHEVKTLDEDRLTWAAFQIIIAMGAGTLISKLLTLTGMTFPVYIGAMFAAAIMRNLADAKLFDLKSREIAIFGDISLSLFLSLALMGLKLWQLASLAGPLVVMLLAQGLLMGAFAYFITFNIMGKDYEAAVMSCGHCGFGMGATPNAMANMGALSEKYTFAPRAFFILPLVGSLFIDFANASVITFFMNMFG
ncbi:sodium/glutamate symporter [Propionigenium maris]|nr:sodium/glutamate symporter [Propionigenium maris]